MLIGYYWHESGRESKWYQIEINDVPTRKQPLQAPSLPLNNTQYCWSTPDWYRHTEASSILIKTFLCGRKADGCTFLLGWAGGFPEMGSHERWTLTYQPSPQPKGPTKSWSRLRLNQGKRWTHLHSTTPQSSRTLIPIKWPTMKKFIASNQKRYIIKTKLKSKVRCKDIEFHPLFLEANRMKMSSEDVCNWQDGGLITFSLKPMLEFATMGFCTGWRIPSRERLLHKA